MSNVVKLKGFERVVVEEFNHEPEGPWHYEIEVWEANSKEMAENYQRLQPSEVREYLAGDLNLFVLKVRACIDPIQIGTAVSPPVWVKGQTFSGGVIRTQSVKAVESDWFDLWLRESRRSGMYWIADLLDRLGMGEASNEVERKAGMR
jgi:hypothetical protein